MQRVNKWGNKMRYESRITKLSPLHSYTRALREKARETERKGRERDTEQVRVCVLRSQMCVLWVNRERGEEGAATNWLWWNSGFVSPAGARDRPRYHYHPGFFMLIWWPIESEYLVAISLVSGSSIQEGGTGEGASITEAFRLLRLFLFFFFSLYLCGF
jgi:hypothetical protein